MDSFPRKKLGPGAVKVKEPLGAVIAHCVMSSPGFKAGALG